MKLLLFKIFTSDEDAQSCGCSGDVVNGERHFFVWLSSAGGRVAKWRRNTTILSGGEGERANAGSTSCEAGGAFGLRRTAGGAACDGRCPHCVLVPCVCIRPVARGRHARAHRERGSRKPVIRRTGMFVFLLLFVSMLLLMMLRFHQRSFSFLGKGSNRRAKRRSQQWHRSFGRWWNSGSTTLYSIASSRRKRNARWQWTQNYSRLQNKSLFVRIATRILRFVENVLNFTRAHFIYYLVFFNF